MTNFEGLSVHRKSNGSYDENEDEDIRKRRYDARYPTQLLRIIGTRTRTYSTFRVAKSETKLTQVIKFGHGGL